MPVGDYLRLLGDETRLRVLHLLDVEPLTVAELQEILDLGQSSISGHLGKLKQAGIIHDLPEGSARRYRLREDLDPVLRTTWNAVREVSLGEARYIDDRQRLEQALRDRNQSWVDRVAGSLHREYAPGRTWESLCHGLLTFARLGRCVDVGAGDGSLIVLLAPQSSSLTCIDPSQAMVAAGTERVKGLGLPHVRYCLAEGESLPVGDGEADSVLFLQSLQYVREPAQALAEAARVLAPGGQLLVTTLLHHSFAEAERYGHRHRGFRTEDLERWTAGLSGHRSLLLPPEARPPRFQSLVFTAQRAGAVPAHGRRA